MVKNLPTMWETGFNPWVRKIPLEKKVVTHSSVFAWRIPMDRGVWLAKVHRVAKSWIWLSNQVLAQHSG